jgi:uncharacterized protein YebE (UPF0316 family)
VTNRRSRSRLENNIRTELRQVGWVVMDWINLGQNRDRLWALANTLINRRGSLKYWAIIQHLSNWRPRKLHGVNIIF